MQRRSFFTLAIAGAIAVLLTGLSGPASATPDIAKPAPAFTGTNSAGKTLSLADLRGRTVVLEWTNHDCPYVRKHYTSGNMQAL
jgi:cytochrome oxidase Cu insertion factor (SCO1/SenC/PrrC family)